MRPYLAIVKDSFRAAMASRVLYVLLLLITVLLIIIAPTHLRETLDWRLSSEVNVRNPERLVRRIVEDKDSKKPVGRIWSMLPAGIKDRMTKIVERKDEAADATEVPGAPPAAFEGIFVQEELIEELNEIISDRKFYRAEDWEGRLLSSEAEELIESGVEGLTEIRSKRLNRLLVSTAVSPTVDTGEASVLSLRYAVWEFPVPITMTHQQFAQMLTSSIPWITPPWYFEKIVLSLGLMIAIVVTANMIPDMFEPGSLNLLLSKPISRWGLFIAKFIGGCVFIGLCAAYLFAGLWVWMGLGMGIWDRAILLSIPLYIIVFAIYFSVSAVVGVLWRSPIVSVILTFLFWGFCFGIGSAYAPFEKNMTNGEFIALLPVEDKIYTTDVIHRFSAWDPSENKWEKALDSGMSDQVEMQFTVNSFMFELREFPGMPGIGNMIAPVYDKKNSQVFSSCYDFGKSLASGKKRLFVGKVGEDGPEFVEAGKFPIDATRMFETATGMVVVSSDGSFHRLDQTNLAEEIAKTKAAKSKVGKAKVGKAKAEEEKTEEEKTEEEKTEEEKTEEEKTEEEKTEEEKTEEEKGDPEFKQPAIGDVEEDTDEVPLVEVFKRIGPNDPLAIRTSNQVDYSQKRDEFAIYRRGKLKIYKLESRADKETGALVSTYEQNATLELELGFNEGMTSRIAFQGDLIVIAYGNGKVITVDAETVQEKNEYQPESRTGIVSVHGSPSGRYFGVLYRNGNLWMLDTESDAKMKKAEVTGQGEVASFVFGDKNEMWVNDNTDRASQYDLASGAMSVRHSPPGGWIKKGFRYALKPFYTICPKPGEFYKVVSHLSSSGDSEANEDVDMNKTFEASNPWGPLWSGLIFMSVMLFIGCVIFRSRDY